MAIINLFFSEPLTDKGDDENEMCAIQHGLSMEQANLHLFNVVMNAVINNRTAEGESYFDLMLSASIGRDVVSPKITVGNYLFNKKKFPKLSLHGDYLLDVNSKKYFIAEEIIREFAKLIEQDFGYEFIDFDRVGKVELIRNEVTYSINEEPHIFEDGRFIKVSKKSIGN